MSKTDPGLEMVSRLAALLQIDDKWSVRSKRGFTWWSYRLAQHIEAGRPKLINGQSVSLVHVYTELLQQVPDSGPAIALAGLANGRATLNAVVFDPTKKTLSECCTALVHEGNLGWMDRLLGFAAILQNTAAHSRAHAAAEATKATIAQSTHPVSGERPAIDEILGVAQAAAATGQSQPSAFAGGLISVLPAFAKSFGFLGFGDASGFSCEVPFSADPAVPLSSAAGGDGTSLVQFFTEQPHPDYGTGALCILKVPVPFVRASAASNAANRLNLAESKGKSITSLFGAWTATGSVSPFGVAFSCFVPNDLAQPGVLENVLLMFAARSRFASARLAPKGTTRTPPVP